jgi:hypothetical protein
MPPIPTAAGDLLLPFVRQVPPWLLLSVLAGLTSAAAFFVIAGRGFRSLPTYLALALVVAPVCQLLDARLSFAPVLFRLGEVDLGLVAVGTWLSLAIARVLRL